MALVDVILCEKHISYGWEMWSTPINNHNECKRNPEQQYKQQESNVDVRKQREEFVEETKNKVSDNGKSNNNDEKIKDKEGKSSDFNMNKEWISTGSFFRTAKRKDISNNKIKTNNGVNMYQVLDDYDELLQMFHLKEENNSTVSTNIKIHQITSEKNDWEERYEVEAMIVQALQEHLKSLESDYKKIIKESDIKMQCLKKEKQDIHTKWHKSHKKWRWISCKLKI